MQEIGLSILKTLLISERVREDIDRYDVIPVAKIKGISHYLTHANMVGDKTNRWHQRTALLWE